MSDDKTVVQPKPRGSLSQGVRLNGMFEIEQLIAEGGMGEVYKGLAVASGDAVAIKVVRPEMSRDPDVMALFRREAAILHDLLHDAIVRYYVFSLEPELQRYYIAMEFVDGVSLQKRLLDGPLTPVEARILLKRIGGALEQAHSRGVIHRDISSDNIILPGGDVRKAKIVDFGIARAARAAEGTIIGAGFAGKYKYVSPEQLGLYGGEVTPRSDIYSFGLVIAEALRGEAIDMGGSQVEVIEKRRTVPDLTGIEMSLRPLLTAMLAPNPADRPENMAEIAAWGEGVTMLRPDPAPAPPPAAKGRGGARAAVAAAVVIVLLGAGAAVYLLRDRLGLGGGSTVATTETPTPVPTLPPPHTETPTPVVTAQTPPPTPVVQTPTPPATPSIPQASDILDQMAPKPSQSEVALAPARVGAAYHAELPGFGDPTGHGLSLHATPAPPAGLALKDLGGGRSEIDGLPAVAGAGAFDVVAVTQAGRSAHMKVALNVAAKAQPTPPPPPPPPPQPPQSVLDLEPATAGVAYSAGLPPFRSPQPVTLHAGPGLPDGLTLNDLGNGLSQLAGEPNTPGRFEFDVVAATAGGAEGRMKVRIEVAPAARPTETPVVTTEPTPPANTTAAITEPTPPANPPALSTVAFLRDYAAEPCFAVRARDDDPAGRVVTTIGADPAAFERFGAAFQQAVRARPELHALVVQPSQCPAVDFLKAAFSSARGLPRISLDRAEVGKNRPLSGTVSGLNGRPLLLMVVDDDGAVIGLRAQAAPGADTATFSASFTGDPSSFGKPQMLIAVAADQPIGAGEKLAGAPSAETMPRLAAQSRAAHADAAVALFKFD
jgi:serine/threonine protein kinase